MKEPSGADTLLPARNPERPAGRGRTDAVTAFYGVMAALSLVTAAVALAAGLRMLRGGPGARGWALGSGILLLCSIWTCCPWPLNLALGIYTLVVVLQDRPA